MADSTGLVQALGKEPLKLTYAHVPVEVFATQEDSGLWTFEIKGDAVRFDGSQAGPFYGSKVEALIAGVAVVVEGLEVVLGQAYAHLNALAEGQPVDLGENNPLGTLVRELAEGILASEELDPSSEFMRQLRSSYEQSKQL